MARPELEQRSAQAEAQAGGMLGSCPGESFSQLSSPRATERCGSAAARLRNEQAACSLSSHVLSLVPCPDDLQAHSPVVWWVPWFSEERSGSSSAN